eukprot:6487278-Amphidinium_carterae.1
MALDQALLGLLAIALPVPDHTHMCVSAPVRVCVRACLCLRALNDLLFGMAFAVLGNNFFFQRYPLSPSSLSSIF